MIRYKRKPCRGCKTPQYIFGLGLCRSCYNSLKAKQYAQKSKNKRKQKQVSEASEKQKERLKEYKRVRIEFLLEKDHCEVATDGCRVPYPVVNPTEVLQVHHKAGRVGTLLLEKKYFLAVCSICHRKVEDFPKWAKDNGYSIPRLNQNLEE